MALGLQLDNPEDVRHQMNVFCLCTLYLGETCCLHLQGELPCFANMKNYNMSLSLNQLMPVSCNITNDTHSQSGTFVAMYDLHNTTCCHSTKLIQDVFEMGRSRYSSLAD